MGHVFLLDSERLSFVSVLFESFGHLSIDLLVLWLRLHQFHLFYLYHLALRSYLLTMGCDGPISA